MSVQELIKRIGIMGFGEVTAQYNATHQTEWRFVFAGHLPVGPNYIGEDQTVWDVAFAGPLESRCGDEEALLRFFMFLRWTLGLSDNKTAGHSSCG